ncbi:hypothetical protein LTR53_010767 [Teratosphaeriaceae sp. CCFEE 6253]|nr:hypothetical protein LTR53_010767 [Teratosphaeriaceae sp. CCFEE 6253]
MAPKLAANTLEGLPDELRIQIVKYALATDEAVNLGPETTQQDTERIKRELLRPFTRSPELRAIAEEQMRKQDVGGDSLVHRLHLESVHCKRLVTMGGHTTFLDPYFEVDGGTAWIGTSVGHVKHLDIIAPLEPDDIDLSEVAEWARPMQHLFATLPRAFQRLKSLVVRVTAYRMGCRDTAFVDAALGQEVTLNEGVEMTAVFQPRIRELVKAVDRIHAPQLRTKEIVFHQKSERCWRTWRNGPLNTPSIILQRSAHGSEDDSYTHAHKV